MLYCESLWISLPDLIGCLGTLLVLVTYVLLQTQKLSSDSILFSFLNLLAALMVLVSLYYAWNCAAVMMEVSWGIISFYGLLKGIFSYKEGLRRKQLENTGAQT